MGMFW